ncbi:hypothetical protein K443DRAFT_638904, partial [Laccaria amethystina LaAM-08-1]
EFQRSRNHPNDSPNTIEAHIYRSFLLPTHFKRWSDLVNSKGGRGVRRHRGYDDSHAREVGRCGRRSVPVFSRTRSQISTRIDRVWQAECVC